MWRDRAAWILDVRGRRGMPPSLPQASCLRETVGKNSATREAAGRTKPAAAPHLIGLTCYASQLQKHASGRRSCPAVTARSLRDGFRRTIKAIFLEGAKKRAAV